LSFFPRPDYIMQPETWDKVLPPHFLAAREQALIRAMEYEQHYGTREPVNEAMLQAMEYEQHQQQRAMMEDEDYAQRHGDMQGDYGAHLRALNEAYDPRHDNDMRLSHNNGLNEDYGQQQHLMPPSTTRETIQLGQAHNYVAQSDQYSDSMQYTDDTTQYYNQDPYVDGTSNGTSEFARLGLHDEGYEEHEAPLDEANANQYERNVRLDPPEDEPPSLSKREEILLNNSLLSASTGLNGFHEETFDRPEYQNHASDDQYADDEQFNYGSLDQSDSEFLRQGANYYVDKQGNVGDAAPHLGGSKDNGLVRTPSLGGFRARRLSLSPDKKMHINSDLPPASPRSDSSYPLTPASARAHELLRRNRRLAKETVSPTSTTGDSPERASTLRTAESNGTWASGSDFTTGDSSVWTDDSHLPDRTSRRALILQMAKARMKKEASGIEEKKVDGNLDVTADFDLTGDLD
jgi:hypothetical protein